MSGLLASVLSDLLWGEGGQDTGITSTEHPLPALSAELRRAPEGLSLFSKASRRKNGVGSVRVNLHTETGGTAHLVGLTAHHAQVPMLKPQHCTGGVMESQAPVLEFCE